MLEATAKSQSKERAGASQKSVGEISPVTKGRPKRGEPSHNQAAVILSDSVPLCSLQSLSAAGLIGLMQ